MKYIAYLKEIGEGCDYTIGCGQKIHEFEAEDLQKAEKELVRWIREWYGGFSNGEASFERVALFEIVTKKELDISEYLCEEESQEQKEKQTEQEVKERKEYERLKIKFGNE